jgi:excisionase family DNA binding protein
MDQFHDYLIDDEAARVARISKRTLQRMVKDGKGPPRMRLGGRRVLYPRAKLLAWIDAHFTEQNAGAA